MLTIPSTPELESRLDAEAAKRGIHAPEYALRLIEGLIEPKTVTDATEQARLDAIDELMGAAADSSFSTAELRRERDRERGIDEERQVHRVPPRQCGSSVSSTSYSTPNVL